MLIITEVLIPYTECVKRYGNHHKIARMVETGELFKIEPGIYSDTKGKPRELELIQARYPTSVVTLLSAYYYYNLTDHIPEKYHLAMERGGTKIKDPNVIQHAVPVGTLEIGVETKEINGTTMRIFDRERLLIETIRMRTKLPYDLYREVIGNFRQVISDMYPAKMYDYLEAFPKKDAIDRIIRSEVF